MGRRVAESSVESQHFRLQSDKIHPFQVVVRGGAHTPEQMKLHSARTKTEATYSPSEVESKDFLEPKHMKEVDNIHSYQNKTKAWRDKKVKLKNIKAGDLVLLRSPRTEDSGKLEPKWTRPFVVIEKIRPGSFRLANNEGRVLEHSWNGDNLRCFYI
jgi:hypothetical protein